jgi:ATP-dependent Lon protease
VGETLSPGTAAAHSSTLTITTTTKLQKEISAKVKEKMTEAQRKYF